MSALVRVEGLRVAIDGASVVDGVSFELAAGECVAIVGESGAGKSLTARSLLGMLPAAAEVSADRLELVGEDAHAWAERDWRRRRGAVIGLVSQDALSALDPLRRVGAEVAEAMEVHGAARGRAAVADRVVELLDRVAVPEPALRARQRPHELSGGLRQRALIASAISASPAVLVADEPTTALDATVQRRVLTLLGSLKRDGLGILLVSHDLAAVAGLADRVLVMRDGRVVEAGDAGTVLRSPRHPFTRALLDAAPVAGAPRAAAVSPPVLEADGLRKAYRSGHGERVAVADATLAIAPGRTLGIVGESGSGKSTLARMLLAIEPPDAGEVRLDGAAWSSLPERRRRARRGRIQLVDQDALGALNPGWRVGRILGEALQAHGVPRADRVGAATALLESVGLGLEHLDRRPAELSGGQRQRVAIARALASEPAVIVCDEPVSALDATVQRQVLDLLAETQERLGLAIVLVSHDLAVIARMADEVLVMRDGVIVERGPTDRVLRRPEHPFTRELVASLPPASGGLF